MKKSRLLSAVGASALFACMPLAQASVIEISDLNIINDAGNASDGLRYLDMTYSDGLTQAAALLNAQGTYSNARLATPAEFNDLFAAAGIIYTGGLTAADGFTAGADSGNIGLGSSVTALQAALGGTHGSTHTFIWTDRDGNNAITTTRDYMHLGSGGGVQINQSSFSTSHSQYGWLLVSDASVVPVPAAAWLFGSGLLGLVGMARRKA